MALNLNPEIFRAVLDHVPVGVYLVDSQRRIVFWNTAAERITGYLGQEVIGRFCQDGILMHCDEESRVLCGCGCPLAGAMLDGRPREADLFLRHKDGQRVPVRMQGMPIRDDFGAVIGSAEFFEPRSFRAACLASKSVAGGDTKDRVTGLPDQRAMSAIFQAAAAEFSASQTVFGVLVVAIENPGGLSQVYGGEALNAALYAAGQTLAANLRPGDVVGRWAKDRFAVLVSCPGQAALDSVAGRLVRLIHATEVPWWGDRLGVKASIGGTMVREGDTAVSLLERAEEILEACMLQENSSFLVV